MVQIEDYDGPLKKVVGTFARPLERRGSAAPALQARRKIVHAYLER